MSTNTYEPTPETPENLAAWGLTPEDMENWRRESEAQADAEYLAACNGHWW